MINYVDPHSYRLLWTNRDDLMAIVTQEEPDAKPILKWDFEDRRNPFSSYVYNDGSNPEKWGLKDGYNEVSAVIKLPQKWYGNEKINNIYDDGALIVLKDCRDSNYKNIGNALFPEILINDLFEVRKTIESYSKTAVIQGYDQSSVCGRVITNQCSKYFNAYRLMLQVVTELGKFTYRITNWD